METLSDSSEYLKTLKNSNSIITTEISCLSFSLDYKPIKGMDHVLFIKSSFTRLLIEMSI